MGAEAVGAPTLPAASRSPRSDEELDLSSGKLGALDGGLDALAQRLIAAGGGSADPDAAAAPATLTTFGTALHTTTPAAGAFGGRTTIGGQAQQTQLAMSLVLHRIRGIGSPRNFIRFSR